MSFNRMGRMEIIVDYEAEDDFTPSDYGYMRVEVRKEREVAVILNVSVGRNQGDKARRDAIEMAARRVCYELGCHEVDRDSVISEVATRLVAFLDRR